MTKYIIGTFGALDTPLNPEANNRKQEIDRQHHTIPNQRANDKHHGNVYNLLFRYGKVRSQNMEKLKSSFPTFCKQSYPQLHKTASYKHSHNADYYGIPLIPIYKNTIRIQYLNLEIFVGRKNTCVRTHIDI